MANNDDILNFQDDNVSDEELMRYISGRLSQEEAYAFERKTIDSDFTNDAVEGLASFSSKKNMNDYVAKLNKQLTQQLDARQQKKKKRTIKNLSLPIIAIVIILVLCLLAYTVLSIMH